MYPRLSPTSNPHTQLSWHEVGVHACRTPPVCHFLIFWYELLDAHVLTHLTHLTVKPTLKPPRCRLPFRVRWLKRKVFATHNWGTRLLSHWKIKILIKKIHLFNLACCQLVCSASPWWHSLECHQGLVAFYMFCGLRLSSLLLCCFGFSYVRWRIMFIFIRFHSGNYI